MKRPDGMYDPEVELELYEEYADHLESLIWYWSIDGECEECKKRRIELHSSWEEK